MTSKTRSLAAGDWTNAYITSHSFSLMRSVTWKDVLAVIGLLAIVGSLTVYFGDFLFALLAVGVVAAVVYVVDRSGDG